jgi:hypothetical protein
MIGCSGKQFPFSISCKMQTACTDVHIFNINTICTIKLHMKFARQVLINYSR